MVKLTFYGGVNEIGGNKILLEDKKTLISLDFDPPLGSFLRATPEGNWQFKINSL